VLLNQESTLCGDSLYGSTVTYVAQQTWLREASIKENILFGQAYDKTRYEQTLIACALTNDLNRLVDGDATRIQPNDMLLTDSLKQRIVLARAVYGLAHHILLDDVSRKSMK
jgi:ABC-type multidrug transport system fused ATPase/permease subunit